MRRVELNQELKLLFGEEFIYSLSRFIFEIEKEQPDVIILMARKAICLFSLLESLNIEKPSAEIVSDNVLDLEPSYFKGKKVVVVDDTLILGTTLRSIKDKLVQNNISHKIFVFCVDEENWCPDLLTPDYIENKYSSAMVLEFCEKEVNGFSLMSIPYLVGFPDTGFISTNDVDFFDVLKSYGFEIILLDANRYVGNAKYILLPNLRLKNSLKDIIGDEMYNLIETIKIRAYTSCIDDNTYYRFAPIVLLKPLAEMEVNSIFDQLLNNLTNLLNVSRIKSIVSDSKAKYSVIQYFLSQLFGFAALHEHVSTYRDGRLFRLFDMINIVGRDLTVLLCPLFETTELNKFKLEKNDIKSEPDIDYVNDVFDNIVPENINILATFQQIFVNLFDMREINARRDAKKGILNGGYSARLLSGIPFGTIRDKLCEKLGIKACENNTSMLSVCLDICNDMGISVPTISHSNIVGASAKCYYRAYRHGELGKRSKTNTVYLLKFLESFCVANKINISDGFDRLLLEKLAVIFYRVGAKAKIIETVWDFRSLEAVNIGFYLHGAVTKRNEGLCDEDSFFPMDSHRSFLSECSFGLLKRKGEKYFITAMPSDEGVKILPLSERDITNFGRIMGRLVRSSLNKSAPLLPSKELPILATCYSINDSCMALTAELKIIRDWILIIANNPETQLGSGVLTTDFASETVYTAFNQALFKYRNTFGTKRNINRIIQVCSNYLNTIDKSNQLSKFWDSYAQSMSIGRTKSFNIHQTITGSDDQYIHLIHDVLTHVLQAGVHIIFIRFLVERYDELTKPRIKVGSSFTFVHEVKGVQVRKLVGKKVADLEKNEISCFSKPGRAFSGKVLNNIVHVEIDGYSHKCLIKEIDNSKINFTTHRYESEKRLYEYVENIARYKTECAIPLLQSIIIDHSNVFEEIKTLKCMYSTDMLHESLKSTVQLLVTYVDEMSDLIKRVAQHYAHSRESWSEQLPV